MKRHFSNKKVGIVLILILIGAFLQINLQCSKIAPVNGTNTVDDYYPESKIENDSYILDARGALAVTPYSFQVNLIINTTEDYLSSSASPEEVIQFYLNQHEQLKNHFDYLGEFPINLSKFNLYLTSRVLGWCLGETQSLLAYWIEENEGALGIVEDEVDELVNSDMQNRCEDVLLEALQQSATIGAAFQGEMFTNDFPVLWEAQRSIDIDLSEDETLLVTSIDKLKIQHDKLMYRLLNRELDLGERSLFIKFDFEKTPVISASSSSNEILWYGDVIKGLGFDVILSNIQDDFMEFFQHGIYNPYRPELRNLIYEQEIDGDVIFSHANAISQGLGQLKNNFLLGLMNWRLNGKKDKARVFASGVSLHMGDENFNESISRLVSFVSWVEDNFVARKKTAVVSNQDLFELVSHFEKSSHGNQFSYPYHRKVDSAYPYDSIFRDYLVDAEFVDFIYFEGVIVGYLFSGGEKMPSAEDKFALIFSVDYDEKVNESYLLEVLGLDESSTLWWGNTSGTFNQETEYAFIYEQIEN